jgi:predicted RNase H-like HicB family nuclease
MLTTVTYRYATVADMIGISTWLGYIERFPDYLTQGESLSDLEENLRDLYRDLTTGEIPGIRSVAELAVE